jgi:hypothetical protein
MLNPRIKIGLEKHRNRILIIVETSLGELLINCKKVTINSIKPKPTIAESVPLTGENYIASMILAMRWDSGSSFLYVKYEHPAKTPIKNTGILAYGLT